MRDTSNCFSDKARKMKFSPYLENTLIQEHEEVHPLMETSFTLTCGKCLKKNAFS